MKVDELIRKLAAFDNKLDVVIYSEHTGAYAAPVFDITAISACGIEWVSVEGRSNYPRFKSLSEAKEYLVIEISEAK